MRITASEFKESFDKSKLAKKLYKATNWKNKHKINHETKDKIEIKYLNIPIAFDIETSSFRVSELDDVKRALMYVWQFAITDVVIIGRTWEEFTDLMNFLTEKLELNEYKRIMIFVHNLGYEFQWIRKKFTWAEVFARESRKIMYGCTTTGLEFRCSYLLTGKKLKDVGEDVGIEKLDDFDYNILKTPATELTEEELAYCEHDVLILTKLIENKIKSDGNITRIPLTKTGYVRRYIKTNCLYTNGKPNRAYKKLMRRLTLEKEEYVLAKEAYLGAFTHASNLNSGITFKEDDELKSFDFTSSYPAVVCQKCGFPMGKGRRCFPKTYSELKAIAQNYCVITRVVLKNLKAKVDFEHIISKSRCLGLSNEVVDNGRLVSADWVALSITEIDLYWIEQFYDFDKDSIEIGTTYKYVRDYLPKEIIMCFLHFYQGKTTLKGDTEHEEEYKVLKEMLNSAYGAMVMDIVSNVIEYNGEWDEIAPTKENGMLTKQLENENNNEGRATFYLWGLYTTSWAKSNLYTGIMSIGKNSENGCDYIYCDTDSLKIKNWRKHMDYFEEYNKNCDREIELCLETRGIDINLYRPKNNKGEEKPLGHWDDEGEMIYFKALRSKAYIYKKREWNKKENKMEENWHLTVAGTGKECTMKYLEEKYVTDEAILENFKDGLEIPPENTGKLTHTYIDDETHGIVEDYKGNKYEYKEDSSIHMEACGYNISMGEYLEYLFVSRMWNK